MDIDSPSFRELILDLVKGVYDLKHYPIPESEFVKNEYAEGSFCSAAYEQMLEAYTRLCERLQVEEWDDMDVEVVINSLLRIGEHQAKKMFEYGVFFARREIALKIGNLTPPL